MESLAGTVDESIDCVPSAAELVDAWAAHERQGARLARAVRRLELSGEWAADGSVSMVAWLRHHCRLSNRDAHALVHRGRFLDTFEAIGQAACTGVLAAGHVGALKAVCSAPVEPVMQLQQSDLVPIVAVLSVADAERAAGLWRQRAEALVEMPEPVEPERELRMAHSAEGLIGKFVLDTEGALQLEQAIRIASAWDGSSDVRSNQRRSADALVDVCAFFNSNHQRSGTRRQRPHVEIVVDGETLTGSPIAWTTDHACIGASITDTYLCDCVVHRVQRAGDAVLAYGRGTRTVPIDLFRAVAARDGGCRHPGCDRRVSWCDAHHIRYWRRSGPTDLENLVLLCSRHHHHVHRYDLPLKLLPDGTVEVTDRDGCVRVSQPRGQPAKGP